MLTFCLDKSHEEKYLKELEAQKKDSLNSIEEEKFEKYKFWFEVYIPAEEAISDEYMQGWFQAVADKIQTVCPFDENDWDYSYEGTYSKEL